MARCDFCGNELSDAQYLLVNDAVYKSCPDCSKEVGQHMHYFCPDVFGITPKRMTTNNPMGLQSHCAKCRSNKKGPHADAFPCSEVKEKEGYIIPEIRFLPMSKDVFATYEDAKEFILNIMPNRGGIYYYMESKMNCLENSFVLFQYDGSLIGYAVYLETVELEKPLEQMLFCPEIEMPYCFAWANEEWKKYWYGGGEEVLITQDYGFREDWVEHFNYLMPFFKASFPTSLFILFMIDLIFWSFSSSSKSSKMLICLISSFSS